MMSDRTAIKLFVNLIFLLLHYVEVKEKYFLITFTTKIVFARNRVKLLKDLIYYINFMKHSVSYKMKLSKLSRSCRKIPSFYLYNVLVAVFNVRRHPFRNENVIIIKPQLCNQEEPIELFRIPIWSQYGPSTKFI